MSFRYIVWPWLIDRCPATWCKIIIIIPKTLSPRIKRPEREAGHSTSSCAEVLHASSDSALRLAVSTSRSIPLSLFTLLRCYDKTRVFSLRSVLVRDCKSTVRNMSCILGKSCCICFASHSRRIFDSSSRWKRF